MAGKVRRMTADEVERLLRAQGFVMVSQKGSHRKWRHPSRRAQVIVPRHQGRILPLGTLRSILTAAEIPERLWRG